MGAQAMINKSEAYALCSPESKVFSGVQLVRKLSLQTNQAQEAFDMIIDLQTWLAHSSWMRTSSSAN